MPGSAVSPTGPAPGPVLKDQNGKASGPQYIPQSPAEAKPTPQEIQKKFFADRASRSETIKASLKDPSAPEEETPSEALADSGEPATSEAVEEAVEPAMAEAPDGASEGQDATGEAESDEGRAARVQEAVRRAKSHASKNRQLLKDIARREQEHASLRARTAQLEAQAKQGADLEKYLRENPLKALEQLGVTPDAIAQRVLQANTPEEKIAALQSQIESERKERLRVEKTIADREAAAQYQVKMKAAEDTFVGLASNAERYPNLQGHPRQALLAMGKQVAQDAKAKYLRETGVAPVITDRQILGYLNKLYAKTPAPKEAPAASATSKTSATGTPKAAAKPSGKASPKPETPRTLTGAHSAGSFVRPANWESLSRTERVKILQKDVRRNG